MPLNALNTLTPSTLQSIRLLATDVDGTLTTQGQFDAALLTALTTLAQSNIAVILITGRSAGWVSGLVSYLPVQGAIAENGGLYFPGAHAYPHVLTSIPHLETHRHQLAQTFAQLQQHFPQLQPSSDNLFRLTDWTFDIGQLTPAHLQQLRESCQQSGWDFTYSSVQCHIKPPLQDKASGLQKVIQQSFPDLTPEQVLTIGDSPNDESLFDSSLFPLSVGVANIRDYGDRLTHLPTFITTAPEGEGFCELAQYLCAAKQDP